MATLKPLKGGKVRVQWYDTQGVRHRIVTDKRRAQEIYESACAAKVFDKSGIGEAHRPAARHTTFRDVALRYRDEHLAYTRATSNAWYVGILIRKWGEHRLRHLDAETFRTWIGFALHNPIEVPAGDSYKMRQLAAGSVKKLVRYATAILNFGIVKKMLQVNPLVRVITRGTPLAKAFKRAHTIRPVVLSVEEFRALAEMMSPRVRQAATIAFYSGLRRSELVALRWSMVDRKARRFAFQADQVKEADAKFVYYDAEAEGILTELEIDYLAEGRRDDIVLRNADGGPLSVHSFNTSLAWYCRKCAKTTQNDKYLHVTPHTLRRSYRVRKDLEGADRRAVMANMGHHTEAMSDHYNIVDERRQSTVAGFVDTLPEQVRDVLQEAVESARSAGLTLADLQAGFRKEWSAPAVPPETKMPTSN